MWNLYDLTWNKVNFCLCHSQTCLVGLLGDSFSGSDFHLVMFVPLKDGLWKSPCKENKDCTGVSWPDLGKSFSTLPSQCSLPVYPENKSGSGKHKAMHLPLPQLQSCPFGETLLITVLFNFNKVKSFWYKTRKGETQGSLKFSSPQILISMTTSTYALKCFFITQYLLNL